MTLTISAASPRGALTIARGRGVYEPVEQPGTSLNALTLSDTQLTQGEAATVDILGATAGSALAGTVPDGMTLDSAARTISGTPTVAGTFGFVLTETLADSANSPRTSNVSIEVVEAQVAGPTITGTPEEYATLSTGATSPQWQRGSGSFFYDIPGATGLSYSPSYADVGMALRVKDGASVSDATSPVAAKPILLDTFTDPGTGIVSIEGRQSDIGGTWAKHPSGVSGVNIDRDADRAVGGASSGNNYIMNSAQIAPKRIRVTANVLRDSSILGMNPAFSASGSLDGYRFYNDGGWKWQRFNTGAVASVHSTGFGSPPVGSEYKLDYTLEEMPERVRLRYKGPAHPIEPVQADDTDGLRKPIAGRHFGLGLRTGTSMNDFSVHEVDASPVVSENAIWTWYNDPRALYHGGRDYVAHIDNAGSVNLSKIDAGITTQVAVGLANNPTDDHNNAGLLVLPGGRIMVGYADHLDAVGSRYKVSSNPLPDISAFGGEVAVPGVGGSSVSYVNLYMLSDGIVRLIRRDAGATYAWCSAPAADVEAGTATWTVEEIIEEGHAYAKMVQSADNHRLYFVFGTGHPDRNDTALYGCYVDVSSGTPIWHDLAENIITAPISRANATLIRSVDSVSGPNNWTWDIQLGADGHPRMLATRYPDGQGSSSVVKTNIEYWHYRWTGSEIVATQIASGQQSLYDGQPYYAGGLCFDGNDASIIYMSTLDPDGFYQVGEYRFDEASATLTKVRNVSSRAIAHNCRPFSPRGHGPDTAVYWWRGKYSDYISYDTVLHREGQA